MQLDHTLLLYSIAQTFNNSLLIPICSDTKLFLKKTADSYLKLNRTEKMYYTSYATKLADSLSNYLTGITLFELNDDDQSEIVHDFRLKWKKSQVSYICMCHKSINIRDIIPEKLMKFCGYTKKTNICKDYLVDYNNLNEKIYNKINDNEKYSDLNDKTKTNAVLAPFCSLVVDTLSGKRKCAEKLYTHLFDEADRIVLKLYKNRFIMYDFGIETNEIQSYKMKKESKNTISVTFNNDACFILSLNTNATDIKARLSLKFRTNFVNIDDLFAVDRQTIK